MANLLIVDDDAAIRGVLQRHLEANGGHRVWLAQDGVEALAALKRESIDIAFVDLAMPRMSGIELIHALDQAHPGLTYVVMSGADDAVSLSRRKLGLRPPLLRKPFELSQVDAIVSGLLGREA